MSELKVGGMCEAYGCPMSGGITASHGNAAAWFCRFHHNSSHHDRDRITHKLRMHAGLLQHLQLMSLWSSDAYWLIHDDNKDDRQEAYAFAGRPKAPDETHWDYVTALEVELRQRIFSAPKADSNQTEA